MRDEGDFLVRQSTKNAAQYVLTGVQHGKPRHLLLIDENGKVTFLFECGSRQCPALTTFSNCRFAPKTASSRAYRT